MYGKVERWSMSYTLNLKGTCFTFKKYIYIYTYHKSCKHTNASYLFTL